MPKMPKVSVIIPTFNRADYLPAAINSVLCQTYTDFEIIVADDGSTDGTERVIGEQFGDRLVYLSKPNAGPASARNLGISAARGEYIAFLDSDDLWLPEKLAVQTKFMDEHPDTGLSFTWALTFGESVAGGHHDLDLLAFRGEPSLRLLLTHNFIPNLTVMVRRQCLAGTGNFDESRELIGREDYELWLRIAMQYRIACIPTVLARYRMNENTLSGRIPASDVFESYLTVLRVIERKFPSLIEETFQDRQVFLADRYQEAADLIPFRGGNLSRKSALYRKALFHYRGRPGVVRKLLLCYLFRVSGTMKKASA